MFLAPPRTGRAGQLFRSKGAGHALALTITRGSQTLPVDEETRLCPGDVVTILLSGRASGVGARQPSEWLEAVG